jgi:hypothetical protein
MENKKRTHRKSSELECVILPHIPTEEELAPYRNSNREVTCPIVLNRMPNDSKEEQLLAQDNFKRYLDAILRHVERVAKEEQEKFEQESKSLFHTPQEDSSGDENSEYIH